MKKEINYLSLPDHFNKFLLSNINQKINLKDSLNLQFRLSNKYHLGSALKAIYLLEIIFPKKVSVLKLVLKKKKLYFGQKSNNFLFFNFNMTLYSFEFIDFFRFFSKLPFKIDKKSDIIIINRKLKQFDFNKSIFIVSKKSSYSFFFFNLYHLN